MRTTFLLSLLFLSCFFTACFAPPPPTGGIGVHSNNPLPTKPPPPQKETDNLWFQPKPCIPRYETTYRTETIYYTDEELRNRSKKVGVKVLEPQTLLEVGKIYLFGQYILISEVGKGIHIINNENPSQPKNIGFMQLRGNVDIAIRGKNLYADSYTDLLVIDISRLEKPKIVERRKNVFNRSNIDIMWMELDKTEIVKEEIKRASTVFVSCTEMDNWGEESDIDILSLETRGAVGSSGTGGSMARFTILRDHLYAVDDAYIHVFKIDQPQKAVPVSKVEIGWNIETIFPHPNGDKLFIGSMNGMYIYSIKNPDQPSLLSQFAHFVSCDPVVIEDTLAFVTLSTLESSGTGRMQRRCVRGVNRLEIVNVSDPTEPFLIGTYDMLNPKGLGVRDGYLYICDGRAGLKVLKLDAGKVAKMTSERVEMDYYEDWDGGMETGLVSVVGEFPAAQAYDVIPVPNEDRLLMVGSGGFFQYDIKDPEQVQLLSQIEVGTIQ